MKLQATHYGNRVIDADAFHPDAEYGSDSRIGVSVWFEETGGHEGNLAAWMEGLA